MEALPPPTTVRVLPTMAMRTFRLKLLKALKLVPDVVCQGDVDVYLVMDDERLTKLDMLQGGRDLSWWGIQHGSRIVVLREPPTKTNRPSITQVNVNV
jgi:hypothetical protein